jgi:hypothetical protein
LTAAPPREPNILGIAETVRIGDFLFPKHGFTTAAWDPPRHGSDFEHVGEVEVFTLAFANANDCDPLQTNFGGMTGCEATYRNAGELLLMNSGANTKGFAICQKCGYAESEWMTGAQGRVDLPNRFEWHAPLNSANANLRCWADGEAPVWRNHHLAAKQTTHLLRIDFARLGLQTNRELLYTLGQALRLAATQMLELDEREISALDPVPDAQTSQFLSIVLYDSLAGGAGHLAELSHIDYPNRARKWIGRTMQLLTVSGTMPDAVRNREVVRRLLTSACNDELLVPEQAHTFLSQALNGAAPDNLHPPQEPKLPPDTWTLERLQSDEPPDAFNLFMPENIITGMKSGVHSFQKYATEVGVSLPKPNAIVVVRDFGDLAGVSIGRWLYQRTTDANRPNRVRLRRITNPVSVDLTDLQFSQLKIIAISTP